MKVAVPRVTQALVVLQVACFLLAELSGRAGMVELLGGFVPARVGGLILPGGLPIWITPLTATVIHAGLLHLVFNLLMLGFCGREDEAALGGRGVIVLYVVGAYAAALGQYVSDPGSVSPMVGSSGSVSALVGAYVLIYGRRHTSRLSAETARWLHIVWLAAAWIAIQFLLGLAWRTEGIVIAAGAHIGGFIAGMLLARPLLRWRYGQR